MPKRTDANQAEIVKALQDAGRFVIDLHTVGRGCPDLLVIGLDGELYLLEVKTPGGRLTPDEIKFMDVAKEYRARRVFVVRTSEDAIALTSGLEAL